MRSTRIPDSLTGRAAGVPFIAVPPSNGPDPAAPVVAAWHLVDAPRTEAAFAAALPLSGLDAWRLYFGLPLTGARLPNGGWEELMQLGFSDAVANLHRPIIFGAAEEFGPALADARRQLELDDGPVGVLGGSAGAAVAQLVLAEGGIAVHAAVLVSPLVQLRGAVAAAQRQYGLTYTWSAEADAVADRLDFVARADEMARRSQAPVQLVVGEDDDPGIREPAAALASALTGNGAELVTIPGMAHALADEPGVEPAPQTLHAAAVDRHAVAWFQRHLTRRR